MPTPLLDSLLPIAAEAAAVIREVYSGDFDVQYKTPGDPVTVADERANQIICKRLGEQFPNAAVVAEESDPSDFAGFERHSQIFFVDPLDGTRDFVKRTGDFVIMIGMVDGAAPVAGVVHAPATNTIWCGHIGHGAWRIDGKSQPIRVSDTGALTNARIVVSRSRTPKRLAALAKEAGAPEVLRIGSAGLKAAKVADGTVDLYIAPDQAGSRWDICAPDALVRAAGGEFTDAFGQPYDYRSGELSNDRGVAAANPTLHPKVLQILARARDDQA